MATNWKNKYVQHWDDERSIGNSLIVSLVAGREFGTDHAQPAHVDGFDTVKAAQAAVRASKPCRCTTCIAEAAETAARTEAITT